MHELSAKQGVAHPKTAAGTWTANSLGLESEKPARYLNLVKRFIINLKILTTTDSRRRKAKYEFRRLIVR